MNAQRSTDRRRHVRQPLTVGVRLVHGPTGKQLPARCVDASEGGALMHVPANAAVKPGQPVSMTFEQLNDSRFEYLSRSTHRASIVRVDRHEFVKTGMLAVGVQFGD